MHKPFRIVLFQHGYATLKFVYAIASYLNVCSNAMNCQALQASQINRVYISTNNVLKFDVENGLQERHKPH